MACAIVPCRIRLSRAIISSSTFTVAEGHALFTSASKRFASAWRASCGLGGCPYAKSATGNLATEDLVWMLAGLGVETGVDLEKLVATSTWMAQQLGRPSPSAVVRALGGA